MLQSYLARQPIFDVEQDVIGYELLYRSDSDIALNIDGTKATTDVLINSYIEVGLDKLVGTNLAFINITRDFIVNPHKLPPPSKQLVLEIVKGVKADEEVIAGIKALTAQGYNLALDNFDPNQPISGLVQLVQFVKINVQQYDAAQLAKTVGILRKSSVKLVAERVETVAQFERCRELGFDYYQGYSLCQPRVVRTPHLSANKLQVMQLLASLNKREVEPSELATLIEQDVVLSYKLLRYINSASLALKNKIDSINHAVVLLGKNNIKQWASMIALSGLQDTPNEVIHNALLHAKMCELLLESKGRQTGESAFMVGLFSMLDTLLGIPMDRLLPMLQFSEEINEALLSHKGPYGIALKCVCAYEKGDWPSVDQTGFGEEFTTSCYMKAMEWCNESSGQFLK